MTRVRRAVAVWGLLTLLMSGCIKVSLPAADEKQPEPAPAQATGEPKEAAPPEVQQSPSARPSEPQTQPPATAQEARPVAPGEARKEALRLLAVLKETANPETERFEAWERLRETLPLALADPTLVHRSIYDIADDWTSAYPRQMSFYADPANAIRIVQVDQPEGLKQVTGPDLYVVWQAQEGVRTQLLEASSPFRMMAGMPSPQMRLNKAKQDEVPVLAVTGKVGKGDMVLRTYDLSGGKWRVAHRAYLPKGTVTLKGAQWEDGTLYFQPLSGMREIWPKFWDKDFLVCDESSKGYQYGGPNCLVLEWGANVFLPANYWLLPSRGPFETTHKIPLNYRPVRPKPGLPRAEVAALAAGLPGSPPVHVELVWADETEGMGLADGKRRFFLRKEEGVWRLADWETEPGTWANGQPLKLTDADLRIYGVHANDTERDVMIKLGVPDSAEFSGNEIIWHYRELGLSVSMVAHYGYIYMIFFDGETATRRGLRKTDPPERIAFLYQDSRGAPGLDEGGRWGTPTFYARVREGRIGLMVISPEVKLY